MSETEDIIHFFFEVRPVRCMDSRLSVCVLVLVVGAVFALDVANQSFGFHLTVPTIRSVLRLSFPLM